MMAEIMVVGEQRGGELRDLTLQMLYKASELGREHHYRTSVILLGRGMEDLVDRLEGLADTVVVYDDPRLQHFDPARYAEVLAALIAERAPLLTLLAHSPWSMDLAPALSVRTGYPLATDCVDVVLDGGRPKVVRQVYSGKLFARMVFREADGYLVTVRLGSFPAAEPRDRRAEVVRPVMPTLSGAVSREFLGYQDTGRGEVDITQAELLVSVGRGIGEEDNIPAAKELAGLLGGTLSCSRPVVDKKWLPKYHQVGTSGKSVKPKVYLALGISGAFQHVAGIGGAGTIVAVNRDKKAPIFRVADYGVVADATDVIAALKAEFQKE